MADTRAVSPVIGKVLEAGLVVLYIGLLTTTLYGSVVPEYRTTAAEEVSERVLANSVQRVQQAVPPDRSSVRSEYRVDIPDRIAGQTYEIRVSNRSLVLSHPNKRVRTSTSLALPNTVTAIEGNWTSDEPAVISVRESKDGLSVRLESDEGNR